MKYKKSLFVICDTCNGKHLRSMTVTKMTSSKNTMDMCYIGLSCLTQIEKKMLDNKMQIGSVSFQS